MQVALRQATSLPREQSFVLWFSDVNMGDVALVGGKNASLGELIGQLQPKGIHIPDGFAVTAYAYRYFLQSADLEDKLHSLFSDLDVNDLANLQRHGQAARSLLLNTPFPAELQRAIAVAYQQLGDRYGTDPAVAVRSSATAEDLLHASFAGQQETYLNVSGLRSVIAACHRCFASLFTDRAISYRVERGIDHFDVSLSVAVQKMVRSDLATSGVLFSIDTETGFRNTILVTAAYGLGENVMQGAVNPDEYRVFKPTVREGYRSILQRRMGSKALRMVYDDRASGLTRSVPVPIEEQDVYALRDDEVLQLAQWACIIEDHYSRLRGTYTPMDIEWAKDGLTGQLFIVQARPETVQSQKSVSVLQTYRLLESPSNRVPLVIGSAVGDRIGQGKVRIILNARQMGDFKAGEVLVTGRTDPDWEPIMKKAAAIVTNQGGRTCHAAIIAREMGVPLIVGCGNATEILRNGQPITVSCAEGEEGKVYAGLLPFEIQETPLENVPPTQTRILMNIGNPAEALRLSAIPSNGVGLARTEFIIANHIQFHPLTLLHFNQLEDEGMKVAIAHLTRHYPHKPDFFVDRLAQGIANLAAAFYPNPVIVRMSDFKSNEYANLIGGKRFEPEEENPMLGWRGASRYYDPKYAAAFGLECCAMKRVRDEMGLTNLIPMIPFCRTPEEGRRVLAEMEKHGLKRGENGLQVYVMAELPSNVLLADEFCEVFDGFSIGSNDLTQLTLGLDRNSALVSHLFDERNPAVKTMVKMLIETAKRHNRTVGICGQAPSDYPEFAEFLVDLGIDSISLNPDSVVKTRLAIAAYEAAKLEREKG